MTPEATAPESTAHLYLGVGQDLRKDSEAFWKRVHLQNAKAEEPTNHRKP